MPETHIQDVWANNFHEEIKKLMNLTQRFNVIAMVNAILDRIHNFLGSSLQGVSWINAIILSNSASISSLKETFKRLR